MPEAPISDAQAVALHGTTDDTKGLSYETPGADYQVTGQRQANQFNLFADLPNALRVFRGDSFTSSVRDFGVRGGLYMNSDVTITFSAVDSQALTNDAFNYIFLTGDGTLTVNTTGFPIPSETPHVPLAIIGVGTQSAALIDKEYERVDMVDQRCRAVFQLLAEPTDTVRNESGGNMTAGDLVYRSGYNPVDDVTVVSLADADGNEKAASLVLLEDIDDGNTGPASSNAIVTINTTALAEDDELFLSATAGEFTDTEPTGANQLSQHVGIVRTVGTPGTVIFTPGDSHYHKFGTDFLQDAAVTADKLAAWKADDVAQGGGDDVVPITHAHVSKTTTGTEAGLTLANGADDQIVTVTLVAEAGPATITPATAIGFSAVTLRTVGESVTFRYTGDTDGWAIIGNYLPDGAVVLEKLSTAQQVRSAYRFVEDLAAGADITDRPMFILPSQSATLISVGIMTVGAGAFSGSGAALLEIEDDSGNLIVSQTYNAGNPPPDTDYEDLGALDATHKILVAGEHVQMSLTQDGSPSGDMPGFTVVFEYMVNEG